MVEILFKRSSKAGKKYDAVIENKGQFHLGLLPIPILPSIKMKIVKIIIQQGKNLIKTGRIIQLPVSGPKIFSGISLPLKLP